MSEQMTVEPYTDGEVCHQYDGARTGGQFRFLENPCHAHKTQASKDPAYNRQDFHGSQRCTEAPCCPEGVQGYGCGDDSAEKEHCFSKS